MLIVKRKYLIKTIALIVGLFAVIIGLILQNNRKNIDSKNNTDNYNISIITNICACMENINVSFNKITVMQNYDEESKHIYANSKTIQNLLYLVENNTEKTRLWFSTLTEYSQNGIQDIEKNNYYLEKISEATNLLINTYTKNDPKITFSQMENFFSSEQKTEKYSNTSYNNNQYFILEKNIIAERKEISDYAQKILDLPFSPAQFKGNYLFPKAISYAVSNSYVNIFPSGKILLNMSIANSSYKTEEHKNIDIKAENILTQYAPYAANCKLIFNIKNDNLVYYIFCPENTVNTTSVINYDETIKIALSANDYALKAFDATKYLKNHSPDFNPVVNKNENKITVPQNASVVSKHFVIHNKEVFTEYKIQCQNNTIYYILVDNYKNSKTMNEREYLSFLDIT